VNFDIELYFYNWPSISAVRILDPHFIKGIKNTRERMRAPDGNWNTGLPFPVSIMVYIKDECELAVEDPYSVLESFKSNLLRHSERTHNGNVQTLRLSCKCSGAFKDNRWAGCLKSSAYIIRIYSEFTIFSESAYQHTHSKVFFMNHTE
jgi:hypothetical protein